MTAEPQRIGAGAVPQRIIDVSTVCNRYLLQVAALKGTPTPDDLASISATPLRPGLPVHHRWPDVLRMMAVAIAETRMRATEPDEAAKFDEFTGEVHKLRREVKGSGQKRQRAVKLETERRRAVFLSRWFPVPGPAPEVWSFGCVNALTTWSPSEMSVIVSNLLEHISTECPAEPAWFPHGWRDAVVRLGGEA